MTIELADVIRIGRVSVAAVVKRSVHWGVMRTISIHGTKRPIAILIRRDDVTMAFEIDGSQIALDNLEQRFPSQRAQFERLAITETPRS